MSELYVDRKYSFFAIVINMFYSWYLAAFIAFSSKFNFLETSLYMLEDKDGAEITDEVLQYEVKSGTVQEKILFIRRCQIKGMFL